MTTADAFRFLLKCHYVYAAPARTDVFLLKNRIYASRRPLLGTRFAPGFLNENDIIRSLWEYGQVDSSIVIG